MPSKMSSKQSNEFRFMDLPGELRNKIWAHTLEPRRITLTCKTISSMMKRVKLPFKFAFSPTPSCTYFPVEQFAYFSTEVPTPIALRVNKESRSYSLQSYVSWQIWKTESNFHPIKYKYIMWDPAVDIVDFLDMDNNIMPIERFLPLFVKQFPLQASRVQRLAVSSSIWKSSNHHLVNRIWSLIDCIDLKEFIIEIDKDYERRVAESLGGVPLWRAKPWTVPQDIEKQIVALEEHHEKWAPEYVPNQWKPIVRVVNDLADIFDKTKDGEVVLRCFPCPELGLVNDKRGVIDGFFEFYFGA